VLQSLPLHFSTTGWLSWDRVSKALGKAEGLSVHIVMISVQGSNYFLYSSKESVMADEFLGHNFVENI